MRPIQNFQEAQDTLAAFVPPAGSMAGNYTLDRMRSLMDAIGNPQDTYKVVHVAGTSGKTSTAYFITALLHSSGKKVGLTVSPHVDEVNERVQIDLIPLQEKLFCSELTVFLKLVKDTNLHPTYFELLIAFAYWEFARQHVEYAVIEVGLGGLLDGTNVIHQADKVCLLTDIGFDHTDILGNTLSSIARQKAGIMLPGNTAFAYQQSDEVMKVFRTVSKEQSATLHEIDQPPRMPNSKLPAIQQRNWHLALCAFEYIALRDNLPRLLTEALIQTQSVAIPARIEITTYQGKVMIFDGSHNAQKIQALVSSIKEKISDKPIAVLVGLLEDKKTHLPVVMRELTSIASFVIAASFSPRQDIPRQPLDPERIAEACNDIGFSDVTVCENLEEAVKTLLKRPEPILLIVGSFYFMGDVRALLHKSQT